MAGFFGFFDYSKEGKGVYPDDPPRGPVATFFSVLGRKFWKILTVNLMYVIFSLPALILSFFAATYVLSVLMPGLTMETLVRLFREAVVQLQEGVTLEEFAASQMLIIYLALGVLLTGLGLIVIGPVLAGITYILRNYSREEHAFVWMDFKDHAKKNFKQALVASLISLVVTIIFTVNIAFYSSGEVFGGGILSTFFQTIMIILFVIWCIMQMYLYPMMITFELSLKQLYKNCLLFTIMRLPLNVLILLLSVILLLIIPVVLMLIGYGITVLLALIWYLFLAFGVTLLLTNMFVYRGLDKYMISRINQQEDETESLSEEDEPDFETDSGDEEDENDKEKAGDKEDAGGFVESPTGAR